MAEESRPASQRALPRRLVVAGLCLLVAVTGYGQIEDVQLAHEAGFDRHLTKPVGFAQLQALLADSRP